MLEFTIYGRPQPQGSSKSVPIPWKGHRRGDRCPACKQLLANTFVTSDNPDLKKWREKVTIAAKEQVRTKDLKQYERDTPVRVDLLFVFKRPKSVRDRVHPTVKPDKDKLERAVLDSLTGVLYADDAQVVQGETAKSYGEWECVKIRVAPVAEEIKL